MLTAYLSTHPDQGILGLGMLLFMLWSGNSQKLKNKSLIGLLALTALLSAARAQELSSQIYTLFLLLHLFLMAFLLPQSTRVNDLRFYTLLWAMGGHLMIEASNWLTVFIGGELFSLPLYAWFSVRKSQDSLQKAASYFLQNALLSSFFLIALALLYGHTHSLNFTPWEDGLWADLFWVLVYSWLFFKLGAAPFSYWVPQIYALLAPVEILWLSLIPKIALIAAISQMSLTSWGTETFTIPQKILHATVIVTALWGHTSAWRTHSWSAFFGYSAIAQNSVMLAPLILGAPGVILSIFIQIIYTASLAIFFISNKQTTFSYRLGLLSLSGLPPTPLFVAKLLIILSLMLAGYVALAAFLLIMSVIALSYYLRIYAHPLNGFKNII